MATTLTKKYRLTYSENRISVLGTFDSNSVTGTIKTCFETDDLAEMKAKIVELGLTLDEKEHSEFL